MASISQMAPKVAVSGAAKIAGLYLDAAAKPDSQTDAAHFMVEKIKPAFSSVTGTLWGGDEMKVWYQENASLLNKILTVSEAMIFQANQKVQHGMGWEGPDKTDPSTSRMVNGGKIKEVNTTRWLWGHSDMKDPSKDVMKEIYYERIIRAEKLKFGNYPQGGRGVPK